MVVTRNTLPHTEWSLPKTNVYLDLSKIDTDVIAVIGAVSREYGLDHHMLWKKSVNKTKFCFFIEELRAKYPFDDIMLMMDNLSVHRCKATTERMDELGFGYVFVPPYSPTINGGVEETWAMGKRLIKQ